MVNVNRIRVHDTRSTVQRLHSRVDTCFSDRSGQHRGGVQVRESGGRGRISNIVGRHVHSLDRRNGPLGGTRDTLLKHTQVLSQRGLVTHSSRDTTQKGGHLRVGLSEAENVVHEKQHILASFVTEVLSHGQGSLSHTSTSTRGLIHLPIHQHALGLALQVNHLGSHHLQVQICALTGTLTDTGKHRETTMSLGDIVDQLHDNDSLPDTSSSEKPNLTTLAVWQNQVNNLDTSDQHLILTRLLGQGGSDSVNGPGHRVANWTTLINSGTHNVEDTTQGGVTNGHLDLISSVRNRGSETQHVRGAHANAPGGLGVQVLHNLHGQQLSGDFRIDSQGSEHRRNTTLKLHVNDSTNNLLHISDLTRSSRGSACATGGKRGNRPRSSPQCLHNGEKK
mmetsp:Transcript_71296/g.119324  ORF Transcript_71296/g.119324 Transcript_71296/m.119324 type:complete len:393 (-) Transcript_71296:21-1199(-)